jgi:hypothetical protein
VVVDKSSQTLSVGGSTTSLTVNHFTETSGNFTPPATMTMSGNALLTSGTYTAGATTNLAGNLTNNGATFTAGSGTVTFYGSSAQTIGGTTSNTLNNVTINNTAGVTASHDQTVNGVLYLQSANASATKGALDIGSSYTLYMGANATNTGTGEVTGTITRSHAFAVETYYTYGHPNTKLKFTDVPGGQNFPSSISVNISIGTALTWSSVPTYATKRQFILTHTGGTGNAVIFRTHYLDSELASGVDESTLSFWSFVPPDGPLTNKGWTNYDVTENYIVLGTIDFAAIPSPIDIGIAPTTNLETWKGSQNTDWTDGSNWDPTRIGAPTSDQGVIIPNEGTTPNDPILPVGANAKYLIIESGGILNSASGATLTLSGSGDVWTAEPAITSPSLAAGLFNAGNSTIIIGNTTGSSTMVGTTDFYNLTINNGAELRMTTGSYAGFSGALTVSGTLDCRSNPNTVEFKGSRQTIPNPNYTIPGYYNLKINSSISSPTWPSQLIIGGAFTNDKTGLSVTGIVVMDGTDAQTINGAQSTTFNDLTINNTYGVSSSCDITVNGALYLQSNNPASLDKGTLAMATDKILNLGASAVTSGPGDVSGTIKRCHTYSTNIFYTFGNANQGVLFPVVSGQTVPNCMTFRVTIGTAPDWSGTPPTPNNITKRKYELAQTGGSNTKAIFRFNYLDNELAAGVNENTLSIWAGILNGSWSVVEYGWSNRNTDLDFVTIQDANISLLPATPGTGFQLGLAPTISSSLTWNGSINTEWTNSDNWTPRGTIPNSGTGAIIPDAGTTSYSPQLPALGAICKYLVLEDRGILNSASGATLSLEGSGDVWSAGSGSVFNAGTNSIITVSNTTSPSSFSGSTNFNNVTIASGALLRPAANSYMGISGALTLTGILAAATNSNIIEFNGTDQSIPNPNGSTIGYYDLIISGSGTKTAPGDLTVQETLIIEPGAHFTVVGTTTLSGTEGIVIQSDATGTGSFIDNGTISGPGTASVERYIDNTYINWHFLSSPVTAQPIWPEFAPTPDYTTGWNLLPVGPPYFNWDFYYFNPYCPTNGLVWVNLRYPKDDTHQGTYNDRTYNDPNSSAGFGNAVPNFLVGKGYLVAYNTSWDGSSRTNHNFTGSLNTSSIPIPIINYSTSSGSAYNLVGNPYPSSINWQSDKWGTGRDNLDNTSGYDYWIWNDSYRNYGVYNTLNESGSNGVSQDIAPEQAFFVRASTGSNLTLTMNNNVREHSSQSWLKEVDAMPNQIRFKLTTDKNTYSDEMIFGVHASYDNGGSAKFWSMYTEAPEIWSIKNGNDYSIDRMPSIDQNTTVTIGIKAGVDGTYTVTASGVAEFGSASVLLEDLKTGATQELKNNPVYSFAANPSNVPARLRLHFGGPFGVASTSKVNDITVYSYDNTIFVRNNNENNLAGDVFVYNLIGQKILQRKFDGKLTKIDLNIPPGLYLANVVTAKENVSRKVVVH